MDYSDQRNEIFQACCIINKRVCDLIIDSSSVENVASKSLVTKLGMKTEKASLSVQNRLDQERYENSYYSTMSCYYFYG